VRLNLLDLPPELEDLLRFGRGVDTKRLKDLGFSFDATSARTVDMFARAVRLNRSVGDRAPSCPYDSDVEAFFRCSPAVVRRHS
jgi:hypothetical protein